MSLEICKQVTKSFLDLPSIACYMITTLIEGDLTHRASILLAASDEALLGITPP